MDDECFFKLSKSFCFDLLGGTFEALVFAKVLIVWSILEFQMEL